MNNFLEVEVRGPLSKNDFKRLDSFFKDKGFFVGKKERILIDFSESVNSSKEDLNKRKRDLRIRSTNKKSEIVLKLGSWGGGDSREEIIVPIKKGQFDNMIKIFGEIGITKGVLCERNIYIYNYENVEFAFIEIPNHSFMYEAEILVKDKKHIKKVQEKLIAICRKLKLSIFDDKDFFERVKLLNKEVNRHFHYHDYKEGFFNRVHLL